LFSGCLFTKYVYIESQWPVIEKPTMPVLPEEPMQFTPREVLLADYANGLTLRLIRYNAAARAHNIEHGYEEAEDVRP
jgi:hypothetical protein